MKFQATRAWVRRLQASGVPARISTPNHFAIRLPSPRKSDCVNDSSRYGTAVSLNSWMDFMTSAFV